MTPPVAQSVLQQSSLADYRRAFPQSERLYAQALDTFPSGVTHDGRWLTPFPVYIDRAEGAKKWSVEGREIIDYWMGHGSLLLGHSHPAMVSAVQAQVAKGTHFGACHELEIRWADAVRRLMPAAERVRFTSSGTEATLMAQRVARIATGREKTVKFAGHFHGWHDMLIPAADPPYSLASSDSSAYGMPGITSNVLRDLVVVPPNDLASLDVAFQREKPACVILEATGGHWSLVPMRGEFLHGVRKLCDQYGVILILDEVITGFRVAPGGAQEAYHLKPDLITLAKILAGGLPGGCLAGRADLMEAIAFENRFGKKMKHPGTYNANPLSAAAGIAALSAIAEGTHCQVANERGRQLRTGLNELFASLSVNWVAYGEFSMVAVLPEYTGPRPDSDAFIPCGNDVTQLDRKIDPTLSHAFRRNLLLAGADFFGWRAMLSSAHTEDDVDHTVAAMSECIERMRSDGVL